MIDYGFIHRYPTTNFHELNLDWILAQMIELRSDMRNFVSQNTIKYADPIQWNITTQYEANTVVIEPISGNAYISSQPVPAGVPISNTDYWSVIGNFSILYESIKESIAAADDGSNINATEARAEGSLLWLNSKLYKVLSDISIGALYITSGTGQNLEEVTIEDLLNDETEARKADVIAINSSILNLAGQIGTEGERIEKLETKTTWFVSSFPGDTTADKLQNAIDYAIENYSGDVIVDIDIDLTGETIQLNKGIIYSDDRYLRYRANLTIKGINGAKIYKNDAGAFFSTEMEQAGDFTFKDLIFVGNVILGGSDDIQARRNGNTVFDCLKIIRITTINCSYTLVGNVFNNIGAVDTVMQSNYSFGDVCTYSNAYYAVVRCYDIKITNLKVEQCNYGLASYADASHPEFINDLSIRDSVLEGCNFSAIALSSANSNSAINGISIINCYFEENDFHNSTYAHIGLGVVNIRGCLVEGCRFAFSHNAETGITTYIDNEGLTLSNNRISANTSGLGGRLCYLNRSTTGKIHRAILINNIIMSGNAVLANNESYIINLPSQNLFKFFANPVDAGYSDANDVTEFCMIRTSASPNNMTNTPITSGLLVTLSQDFGIANNVQWFYGDTGAVYCRFKTAALAWTTWKTISS